jgi:FkbM family methyltransferase
VSTTDIPVYKQVFVARDYDSGNLPQGARTIVDLGANIGLSTIFFALKYLNAAVLSVEPDPGNFSQLMTNIAPLGNRAQALMAAAWSRDGVLSLVTEDIDGRSLGADAIQVTEKNELGSSDVPCFSVASLLRQARMEFVDILKVDIEGAENEVFSKEPDDWLARVGMIIIETHDRFKPGSEKAVRDAIKSTFEELPRSGELLFFRRIRS